jgi:GT2 family glycosyltransferase
MNKTAIIVISHNNKDITSKLCENIINTTKSDYDLLVVETGSKKEELTVYPTLWLPDGIRMTAGINEGIQYMFRKENYDLNINNIKTYYDYFWVLVNDTILPDYDVLTPMIKQLKENKDIAEIHPSIQNSPSKYLRRKENGKIRYVSFCEIVCPLFTRDFIQFTEDVFDNKFKYGWGLDYFIPYLIYMNNKYLAICNEVEIIHEAGTTVKTGKDENFKSMTEQFNKSRENMLEVLKFKLGDKWYKKIFGTFPNTISKEEYIDWIINIGQNCKYEDLFGC